jgi:collagen type IV alpha-3-binding protein
MLYDMSAAGEKTLLNVSDDEDVGHLSDNEDDQSLLHGGVPHQQLVFSLNSEFASNLFKWTNYINGWQERFIVLKDGVLSYYRSQSEMNYGCRGAITIKQSTIIVICCYSYAFILSPFP